MGEEDLKEKRERVVKSIKSFFSKASGDSAGSSTGSNIGSSPQDELAEKREQMIKFIKEKKQWLIYILLGAIIWFGCYIRTKNFWLLKDVVTGAYVSVDLDSHIYLKYAKEILENGFLSSIDMSRFVPFGAPTANYAFPAYFIYYLYKVMHLFNPSVTLDYADVVYPVLAFAIGAVFFFLLARRLFNFKVALVSTLLLAIMPAFLQRTMGGSSDHDALGIMFMFMAMYFFVVAWQSKAMTKSLIFGALAGIATGATGLSWGAWKFLMLVFGLFMFIEFFLHKVEEKHIYQYALCLAMAIIVMTGWVPLFTLKSLIMSLTTGFSLFVLLIVALDLVLYKKDWLKLKPRLEKINLPSTFVCVLISLLLGILLLSVVLGPLQLIGQLKEARQLLIHPMGKDRWELTVAEQHQPYFNSWVSAFGPYMFSIPLVFALFLAGVAVVGYRLGEESKNKLMIAGMSLLIVFTVALSRYSSESSLNGTSTLSNVIYFGGFIVLACLWAYYIFQTFYHNREAYGKLSRWDSNCLFALLWLLFMLIAARGAIRLIFVFAPVVALFAGYALVYFAETILAVKRKIVMYPLILALLFVLLSPMASPFAGVITSYAQDSIKQGTYSGPPYNQQWQIAGAWVRENIPQDAVFGHWWDYGYWVQNGWERASVLDGANKVKYWNYLMGRHVLTGQTQREALEFLQVHKATHFLIVAEEIGKYTAYSSIGSDENYDRYSWITSFDLNPQASQETRNATIFVYQGGYMLDDNFVWEGRVYPRMGAGIGAILLPVTKIEEKVGNDTIMNVQFGQPKIALFYQKQRVDVPLECLYVNGKVIKFPEEGYKGCFRIMPALDDKGNPQNPLGSGIFISEEGMRALWVNLYVLNQKNPDYDTSAFKSVFADKYISDLAMFRGNVIGPIRIWEINYPQGFKVDEETKKRYLGGNELLPEYFFKV
ncbi:MAG: STT3 domain-containing protein [Nanoarchaeota archaeon]